MEVQVHFDETQSPDCCAVFALAGVVVHMLACFEEVRITKLPWLQLCTQQTRQTNTGTLHEIMLFCSVVLECRVRHLCCPPCTLTSSLGGDFICCPSSLSHANLLVVSVLPLSLWRGVSCGGCVPRSQGAVLDGGDRGRRGWTVDRVMESVVSICAGVSARGGVEMVDWL